MHRLLLLARRYAPFPFPPLADTSQQLTGFHPPRQSPELLAILSAIQLQQDRQTYAALTSLSSSPYPSSLPLTDPHDPAFTGRRAKTVAEEWNEIRREVGAIVNVGASMAAVGTAVWWVGGGRSYAAVGPFPLLFFFLLPAAC